MGTMNKPAVEMVATDKLIPYARNAKKHDEAQVSLIAGSIRQFGFNNPILIAEDNGIVAGHGRVLAAMKLGMAEVPCIRLSHLDENQRRAYILADNRLAEIGGGWDLDMLAAEMDALGEVEIDVGELGFDEAFLSLMDLPETESDVDAEAQIDKAEELCAKWGVKTGQLWQLGDHRLLCGDSTKAEDVERCLGGVVPLLMVTDPPYGVEYEGGAANERKREKLAGDESADLYGPALAIASEYMPVGAWYVWHASRCAAPVYAAIDKSGFEIRALLIWNKLKPHYGAPSAHYCQKHEPCMYAVRGNAAFCGPSNECTVWDIDQPSRNEHHPTQKPLECMARPIRNHESECVYEPFSGSGTTLIACEQLGRKCLAIEIHPPYVAVALQRWADATGKTPVLI
jgi:DNA modification methylase